MSDKLAELLAKKKAARAERPSSALPSNLRATSSSHASYAFEDDDEDSPLGVCEKFSALPLGSTQHQASSADHLRRMTVVEVDIRDVEMDETRVVAQGGLGILYRGEWRGCDVAIKKPVDPRAAMDASLKEDFEREVYILGELRHPNIVMLMAASLRPPNLCMVFEWCAGGSLYHVIRRSGDLGRHHRFCIAACVASALAFLHSGSPAIIHRDVKSQNVLLDDPVNPVCAKLCDFGLAIKLSEASETNACQGTPPYMAPELFRGEACSLESDVYAFGLTLWELFSGDAPFAGCSNVSEIKDQVLKGERPPIPLTCPREVSQLIKDCWAAGPPQRPRMVQVLRQLRGLQAA